MDYTNTTYRSQNSINFSIDMPKKIVKRIIHYYFLRHHIT